jgi:phosphatidylinositol glycan class Q protein
MHPFSILTLGIFVAGYITARWDLVTRLYELAIFAWDHGVVVCFVVDGSERDTPPFPTNPGARDCVTCC